VLSEASQRPQAQASWPLSSSWKKYPERDIRTGTLTMIQKESQCSLSWGHSRTTVYMSLNRVGAHDESKDFLLHSGFAFAAEIGIRLESCHMRTNIPNRVRL